LIEKYDPSYVIIAPPSDVHLIYREEVEEFVRWLEQGNRIPVAIINWLPASEVKNKVILGQELQEKFKMPIPPSCYVLPKIVQSFLDVFKPLVV
jgi:hypothetical protein